MQITKIHFAILAGLDACGTRRSSRTRSCAKCLQQRFRTWRAADGYQVARPGCDCGNGSRLRSYCAKVYDLVNIGILATCRNFEQPAPSFDVPSSVSNKVPRGNSFGLTPGTYVCTRGTGAEQSFTIEFSTLVPAALPLFATALGDARLAQERKRAGGGFIARVPD
jgi:hypothetical protein